MQTVNAFGIEAGWICKAWEEKQHPRDLYGKFTHAQTTLRKNRKEISVDRELAPTIKQMWAHGMNTYYSCQGSPKLTDKYHDEGEIDIGLGYVFMQRDHKWDNLVAHWAHSRDQYPDDLHPLIDRIVDSNVTSHKWDEDDEGGIGVTDEKVLHKSDSPWRTEIDAENPFWGEGIVIRFPKEDGKLLAKLLAATPRQRRDT